MEPSLVRKERVLPKQDRPLYPNEQGTTVVYMESMYRSGYLYVDPIQPPRWPGSTLPHLQYRKIRGVQTMSQVSPPAKTRWMRKCHVHDPSCDSAKTERQLLFFFSKGGGNRSPDHHRGSCPLPTFPYSQPRTSRFHAHFRIPGFSGY